LRKGLLPAALQISQEKREEKLPALFLLAAGRSPFLKRREGLFLLLLSLCKSSFS
jgi:hypothetical protein